MIIMIINKYIYIYIYTHYLSLSIYIYIIYIYIYILIILTHPKLRGESLKSLESWLVLTSKCPLKSGGATCLALLV